MGNVTAWLTKIKLMAKLYGIDDLVSSISLYIERSALALYLKMEEKDQLNTEKIEVWMMGFFNRRAIHGM